MSLSRLAASGFQSHSIKLKYLPSFFGIKRQQSSGDVYSGGGYTVIRPQYWVDRVGDRDMLGFGINGTPIYFDSVNWPFPAIRYKETTPQLQALKEKERGDWKLLSQCEKKTLYRSMFCQTFIELNRSGEGRWMEVVGLSLVMLSLGIWLFILMRVCLKHKVPKTFSEFKKRSQLRRQIHMYVDPVWGQAKDWDYEKWDWKDQPFYHKQSWKNPPNPFVRTKVCRTKEE